MPDHRKVVFGSSVLLSLFTIDPEHPCLKAAVELLCAHLSERLGKVKTEDVLRIRFEVMRDE